MGNCTPENKKISKLVDALKKIGVKSEIKLDTVVVFVGKQNKKTGSFYRPLSTAKMKSGMIISKRGRVNLFLRKFLAELGNKNQVIARPIQQESSAC